MMNKTGSRPVHDVLDDIYAVTAWSRLGLLRFEDNNPARLVCDVAGTVALLSGRTTTHEGGLLQIVPFKYVFESVAGSAAALAAALAAAALAAPWLFGFADNAKARNVVAGLSLLEAAVVALTRPDNEYGAWPSDLATQTNNEYSIEYSLLVCVLMKRV